MCSAFNPDCEYDKSTIILIRDVYCPKTKCSGKLCLHKKTFKSLGRSDYQIPHCASVCQVFFLVNWSRCLFLEENPKSIQDVFGDVYCPGEYCLHREKCQSLGGYVTNVTTPKYIYGFGKCGAWLFVHKVPSMLQEHKETTKTDRTRFLSAKKKLKLLPEKQLFIEITSWNNSPPITVTRTKKVKMSPNME